MTLRKGTTSSPERRVRTGVRYEKSVLTENLSRKSRQAPFVLAYPIPRMCATVSLNIGTSPPKQWSMSLCSTSQTPVGWWTKSKARAVVPELRLAMAVDRRVLSENQAWRRSESAFNRGLNMSWRTRGANVGTRLLFGYFLLFHSV